jgi:hypothetical protein
VIGRVSFPGGTTSSRSGSLEEEEVGADGHQDLGVRELIADRAVRA